MRSNASPTAITVHDAKRPIKQFLQETPEAFSKLATQFYTDVPYGTHPHQTLDILVPAHPRAWLVYFHGGGFTGGDKSEAYTQNKTYENLERQLKQYLTANLAVVSVNYRLLQDFSPQSDPLAKGVLAVLQDGDTALRFLQGLPLNIDAPENMRLHGTSAGAGMALWLAFRQAMPSQTAVSNTPYRIQAVAANDTQASYDLKTWEDTVFAPYGLQLSQVLKGPLAQDFLTFYGINTLSEFAGLVDYRQQVDLLGLMSAQSPPFRVSNQLQPLAPPLSTFALLHHAYHGLALVNQAKVLGLDYDASLPALQITPTYQSSADFLLAQP